MKTPDEKQVKLWNGAINYLKESRYAWWNQDYMEFLIEKVWKVTKPVDIIDFGCGIGFLGELLMPMLPKGSTYTGVDIGDALLEEAKKNFQNADFETTFIHADLKDFSTEKKYDIAICQAVLQHISDPLPVVDTMKESVKPGGMVIGLEVSRNMFSAALYVEGLDIGKLNLLGYEQKLRRSSKDIVGKDFEIGLRLPVYLHQIGLKNVGVRLSDYVQFFTPDSPDYDYQRKAFSTGASANTNKQDHINYSKSHGLTEAEAEQFYQSCQEKDKFIQENYDNLSVVNSNCIVISYGYRE